MANAYLASHGIDLAAEMDKIQFEGVGTNPNGHEYRHSLTKRLSFNRPNSRSSRRRTLNGHPDASRLHISSTSHPHTGELTPIHLIRGARLPRRPLLWDINIAGGKIWEITPHDFNSTSQAHCPGVIEAAGRLVAPSLCHAHIHLDKCFLLQDPRFSDLQIVNGDFDEAMQLTSAAKARFSETDLLRRGRQLIEESIASGVTAMRAFVEVDGVVDFGCLDAGLKLKSEYAPRCDIQIVAFAQLPLFSGPDSGTKTRKLMAEAASRSGVDVLGSTPYVEADLVKQKMNVRWITSLALRTGKPLDLHLDYHLDASTQPLIWSVLDILQAFDWNARSLDSKTGKPRSIVLGHCTRLTLFNDGQWLNLKQAIGDLPVSFIGLPTSDLFMMRTEQGHRGSLHVPDLINKHGLDAAIAVNNVGNAFTPQGSCDPLSVASMAVGLYSAGTRGDAELLYVSPWFRSKVQPSSFFFEIHNPQKITKH
jgi:hypothetical protein